MIAIKNILQASKITGNFSRQLYSLRGQQIHPPPGNKDDRPNNDQLLFIRNSLVMHLPNFFREIHCYGLYSKDVVFFNNFENISTIHRGIKSYVSELSKLRSLAKFGQLALEVNLLSAIVEDQHVKIRWRISSIPIGNLMALKLPCYWRLNSLNKQRPTEIDKRLIDGISMFIIQGDGYIKEHHLDRQIDHDHSPNSHSRNPNGISSRIVHLINTTHIHPETVINSHESIDSIFNKVIKWSPNLFSLPGCKESPQFISILASFYEVFSTITAPTDKILKGTVVFPQLILQKDGYINGSTRRLTLACRLKLWNE
ncbi:hypothetical protein GJ496_010261 [Pomphorhynchus laevis]|nr:hypothetical protein GJ496_010261 [Pomphorhynchus laevis]